MARDVYYGFEIQNSNGTYRVMIESECVHTSPSYDAACEWIERQAPRKKSQPLYID